MNELIERNKVLECINNCILPSGYVDTCEFATSMRKIFNLPITSETTIRADERRKFAIWLETKGGRYSWNLLLAEYEKEQKNE